jgi:flagellar assembly factor FliW
MEDKKQVIDCFEEQLKNALNNTSDSCISINHHREIWELILKAIQDTKQALTTKSKKEQAFDVIVEKPFVCANAINYIKINKKNPVMLDYDHYCMAVNLVLKEKDYEILKEAILNED